MDSPIIEDDNAPDAVVKPSSIEGWGLFAGRNFAVGETIIDYNLFQDGWYKLKYTDLTEEQIRKSWYVMIDNEWCVTCDRWSKFSYINHSRNPNCLWLLQDRLVVASVDIPEGEELFIDYRLEPRPTRTEYPSWV